jgi:hypothetical protein
MRSILAVLLFALSVTVNATPVQWTLQDVVFNDGGSATGSFFYDADTNVYSDISITTTAGSLSAGQFYEFENPELNPSAWGLKLVAIADPITGTAAFNLNLNTSTGIPKSMTNAGGTIDLGTNAFEAACYWNGYSNCTSFGGVGSRNVLTGTVSAVPIPAAVWLFGSALAGLGWMRRKQTV